jgi:thiol:disulfide interchange protein DsbC
MGRRRELHGSETVVFQARLNPTPLQEFRAMRQFLIRSLVVLAVGAGMSGAVFAQAASAAPAKADPRAAIAKKFGDLKLEDVRMSPVNGIYEITRGSEISYVTADGKYAILGDMLDVDSDANLSENRRRSIRAHMIEAVPENEMLVFSPKDPKYTITVFTDIDCGYCRRLHSQIAEYNRLGIRVRYMFFPRSGPDTESWHKAEAVWCSSNRNEALTRAKNGENINAPKCPTDIIKRDYELGQRLAVDGTPAIFLQNGEMLPGYAPPGALAKYLKSGKMCGWGDGGGLIYLMTM